VRIRKVASCIVRLAIPAVYTVELSMAGWACRCTCQAGWRWPDRAWPVASWSRWGGACPLSAPDTIWIFELWRDEAAHRASLELPQVRATIERARPLIAGIDGAKLEPAGGVGLG
jgi:hypothetical protein